MNAKYQGPLDYIDVASRIVEFRGKFPEGSLQQVKYELLEAGGKIFLAYTAAAYRAPDDTRPGIGTAWEPVPGPTQFTRDSEMQNAETAAWGRAIVAALAADTKKGVASAEEVRNRQQLQPTSVPDLPPLPKARARAWNAIGALYPQWTDDERKEETVKVLAERNVTPGSATVDDWNWAAQSWEDEKRSTAA